MMENREFLNKLFDIYKSLLTDVEQDTFVNYYQEDLTLSEIADNRRVSKSSVSKTLKGAVDKLNDYENKLHINNKYDKLKSILELDDLDGVRAGIRDVIEV